MHQPPQPLDRVEMWAVGRNEMQFDPAVLMTPLIFDSRITMSMQAATLLDTAFCIQVGYVTRGVTRSAGPASRCRWQDDLGSEPTTLESQKKK